MSAREPREILAEFGRELRRARLPRRRRRRGVAMLIVAVLGAGGATAVAANTVWAPSPELSEQARPAGAPVPDEASRPVRVAAGDRWSLSASVCRFGARATVALFMTVPDGGAGRRCDTLPREVAHGAAPPPTLFVAPGSDGRGLLFGSAPAGTIRVQALILRSSASRAELRDIRTRAIRGKHEFAVYVAAVPREVRLITVVGVDADGRPTVRCDQELCR